MDLSLPTALLPPSTLQRLTHSLPEQIAQILAQRIIEGALPQGGRIIEQDVANEFRVSRGPVREALRILEREGLIVVLPRRGAVVTKLSEAEVRDLFDIRAALAQLFIQRATERADDAVFADIESRLDELDRLAPSAAKTNEFFTRYHDLNMAVARASGNAKLAQMVETLSLQARRYSRLGLASRQRRQITIDGWRRILAHMRAGRAAEAARLTAERVQASCQEAIRLLRKNQASD